MIQGPITHPQWLSALGFYDQACQSDVGIVVATGEARVYANILLTIGVVA